MPVDAGNGCVNQVTAGVGDGHHNPGQDCMNNCHNHGFTIAGTVFTTINGGAPVIGATVRVKDAANQTVDIVTQANGNFYTSTPVTFPIHVLATRCPTVVNMSSPVTGTTTVGCNKSGCHTGGFYINLQ